MKIGLISDTHGWIHPRLYNYFSECDEVWHAGDIGNAETVDALSRFKQLRAVYGNIDNSVIRKMFPQFLRFRIDEVDVLLTHIGGYPDHYFPQVKKIITVNPPDLFICGHSHIAKVMFDKKYNFLFINPGAAGFTGFHKFMTATRFEITGKRIHDLELIELGERGRLEI
jgi:putative phosphoesterase